MIIDCSSIIYAAFYTMGNLSYNGRPTGVIYGFLKKVLHYAKKFKTTDFIFCWDAGVTHRQQVYKDYKANRHTDMTLAQQGEREDMLAQSVALRSRVLPALGFHNSYIQHLFEADDLMAYWVLRLHSSKDLIVVSGDSDMYQLLNYCRLFNPAQKKMITKDYFQKRYGVRPGQWPMAKAVGGCSGDNVVGIEGAADPKYPSSKALKYVRGELKKGKIYDRILSPEGSATIRRNLPLVTLPYKAEGVEMKRMVVRQDKFTRRKFLRTFDKFHFVSLLEHDNFKEWEATFLYTDYK